MIHLPSFLINDRNRFDYVYNTNEAVHMQFLLLFCYLLSFIYKMLPFIVKYYSEYAYLFSAVNTTV
jgi:hypothetical protein